VVGARFLVLPLLCLATVANAQPASPPTSVPDSLLETASLQPTMAGIVARCVQLSPDQKDVFEGAYQGWLQRNFNEVQFVQQAVQSHFSNNPPDKARFEAQLSFKVSNDVKQQDLNAAKCTQWLVQLGNSRGWDFAARLAPHMRLIESRFVKPS
jgi:hypothetical protein